MIISKTPLRASFFGGGSDFSDYFTQSKFGYGQVISTALNMYVYITVSKKFDDKIRVCYSHNEIVDSVDDIQHNIIREALKMTNVDKGIEIVYTADLPLGTAGVGLSSSSAIAVGTLNALLAYQGVYAPPGKLAKMACELEIGRLANPIGIQDQYAVAFGGFRRYRFFSDGSVTAEPRGTQDILGKLRSSLMLFYTGLTRNSNSIMKEQTSTIEQNRLLLDSMVEDVDAACKAMKIESLDNWGTMLDSCWEKKRKFAKGVSNETIDEMYAAAKKAGALGGKILGAGGGGFLLLYVSPEKKGAVRSALSEYREIDFNFEPSGSQIIFCDM